MDSLATFYQANMAKAQELHARGKIGEAETIYHQMFNTFGMRPELLQALGTIATQKHNNGFGIYLLEQAILNGYERFEAYHNLAAALRTEHKVPKAEWAFSKAFEVADGPLQKADALVGKACLYVNAGCPEKAIELCDQALKEYPDHRFALWNRGIAYLEQGNWKDGFHWYDKAGFRSDMNKPPERKVRTYGDKPEWFPGKETRDKTVVVYGEQGIGDEIMFASVLPDLIAKSGRVIIDCDKRLERLFKRSFPQCTVHTTSGEEPTWIKTDPPDYRMAMGSLGKWFRRKNSDFPRTPFLKADPDKRAYWRQQLEGFKGRKIGISWVGGSKYTRADLRSVPLPLWKPIIDTDCHVFSLQYHKWAADECAEVGKIIGKPIHHWQDTIDDYEDTAAFASELDLIITVNTSLLHLCGALGLPTWCLTPYAAAWRYGLKGPHPFYGSVEMFRQGKDEGWEPVIERVAGRLVEQHSEVAA